EQAEDTVCRFAPSQAIRRKPLRAQSWGEGESGEDHLAWLPTLYYEEVYVKGFVQGYSLIDANNTGSSHGSHNIGVSVVFRTGRAAYQSHRALFSTAQRGWDRSSGGRKRGQWLLPLPHFPSGSSPRTGPGSGRLACPAQKLRDFPSGPWERSQHAGHVCQSAARRSYRQSALSAWATSPSICPSAAQTPNGPEAFLPR